MNSIPTAIATAKPEPEDEREDSVEHRLRLGRVGRDVRGLRDLDAAALRGGEDLELAQLGAQVAALFAGLLLEAEPLDVRARDVGRILELRAHRLLAVQLVLLREAAGDGGRGLGVRVERLDRDDVRVRLDLGRDLVEQLARRVVEPLGRLDALGDRLELDERHERVASRLRVVVDRLRALDDVVDRVRLRQHDARGRLVLLRLREAEHDGHRGDEAGEQQDQRHTPPDRLQVRAEIVLGRRPRCASSAAM